MSFSEQAFDWVVKHRIADDLFAHVSSDGRRVTLFQKCLPLQFGTHDGEDAPDYMDFPRTGRAQP